MISISLNGEYKLKYKDEQQDIYWKNAPEISAQVPGNVEIDLMAAGILPDIYFGNNIKLLKPYEFYMWRYEKAFNAPKLLQGQHAFLHFAGVDCIADYSLNGDKLAHTENALIDHRFDVTDRLHQGENILVVELHSPMLHAAMKPGEAYDWAYHVNYEALRIRKAPSAYGWDIMPRVLSAGLWRDVTLEIEEENEILDLYFATLSADEKHAKLTCSFNLRCNARNMQGMQIRLHASTYGDKIIDVLHEARFVSGRFRIDVENPALWWPYGYGEANVYDVKATLLIDGIEVAEYKTSFGIRTAKLVRTDISDANGGEFVFIINGQKIMCKGSNWVPADALHSRDAFRYEKMLSLWTDTGCNIVRCWGGNVYEDHPFFDYCDRHGIMVWQDFAMACAAYPQDEDFLNTIRKEAEAVICKLRNHPSLLLWSGDNECDVHIWSAAYCPPQWNRITREVFTQVIRRLDPHREYLPSSPYVSGELMNRYRDRRETLPVDKKWPPREPYKEIIPEDHPWGARDFYKSDYYRHIPAHFISEIGYHGCNSLSSIQTFISQDKMWPWHGNDEWITHASEMTGNTGPYAYRIELMAKQIHQLFGIHPDNLEDFILASQISQAEAKKYFIETSRMMKWRRTGIIWWNMIDGWPQFSDAVVSYDFIKKLAYYYIKCSQQPVCMMISEPLSWSCALMASNDTLKEYTGNYRVWDADTDETLAEGIYRSPANETVALQGIQISYGQQRLFLIEWDIDGVKHFNHYLLGMPPFSLERYKGWISKISKLTGLFDSEKIGK